MGLMTDNNVSGKPRTGGPKIKCGRGDYIGSLELVKEIPAKNGSMRMLIVKYVVEEVVNEYEVQKAHGTTKDGKVFEYEIPPSNKKGELVGFPILMNYDDWAGIINGILTDLEIDVCGEEDVTDARLDQYLEDPEWFDAERKGTLMGVQVNFNVPNKPGKAPWPTLRIVSPETLLGPDLTGIEA